MTKHIRKLWNKAQTSIELAVFGAILVFVLSLIIRQTMGFGYLQNQNLKAMRKAMAMSYLGGTISNAAARNTSSVMIIEDRLIAGTNKYGEFDRTPQLSSGSAIHSRNLFMPNEGEPENVPVMDLFVNGKHFVFTVARVRSLDLSPGSIDPETGFEIEWDQECATRFFYDGCPACGQGDPEDPESGWWCGYCCADYENDCETSSPEVPTTPPEAVPCAYTYQQMPNHKGIEEWCDGGVAPWGLKPCPPDEQPFPEKPMINFTADQRFDLDRNGALANPPMPNDYYPSGFDVPEKHRPSFAWQWYKIMAFDEKCSINSINGSSAKTPEFGNNYIPPSPTIELKKFGTDYYQDGMLLESPACKEDCHDNKNLDVDIDGDLKEEKILALNSEMDCSIRHVTIMDYQGGDLDYTLNSKDEGELPGFTNDLQLFSFIRGEGTPGLPESDGTWFHVREGKLYSLNNNMYVETKRRKDTIDVIQRIFRLSNDNHVFCDQNNNPPDEANLVSNPVEACGNCFSPDHIDKTCMDKDLKLIFVRSRIWDTSGDGWVTNWDLDTPEFVFE